LPALFNLGFIAKKQRNDVQAETYLDHALRIDPNYSDALYELGSLKREQKKYLEAIPLLKRSTETSLRPAQAYYKLALAERDAHQREASQRDMNVFTTLSKNPQPGPYPLQHFFDYLERRGALSEEQKSEAELHQLQAEVQQHPDRPRGFYLLANAFLKLNRISDAMQAIKQLDELSGVDFRTNLRVGVLLGRYRLYPDAILHLAAAVRQIPNLMKQCTTFPKPTFRAEDTRRLCRCF
jgi:tetratricopeptide (TPR) repeat protein